MTDAAENPTVNCPHCGAPNDAALPACLLCGTPLAAAPAQPPTYPSLAAPIGSPPTPAPAPGFAPYAYPPPTAAPAPPVAAPRATRNGLWLGIGLGLIAGLCLFTLLAGGALLAVNNGLLAAATPTPPDPAALLDEAVAAQAQQKAMHFNLTGDFTDASSANLPDQLIVVGDVAPPDSYTMHSDQFGDSIVIGTDRYIKAPGSSTWQRGQTAPDPANLVATPLALLSFLKYYNPDSTALQPDVISGTQRLKVVRFEVDLAKMAAQEGQASPGAVLLGSQVQGTVRLDASTHLVDRLILLIATPTNNTATLTLNLSRYNVPVTITPPPGVGP